MEITQLNLNHAHQFFWRLTSEKSHIKIVAEPSRVPFDNGSWIVDGVGIAAIHVMGRYPHRKAISSMHKGCFYFQNHGDLVI